MGAYYDEIEIEDMTWDNVKKVFHYPCPCGDRFEISKAQLRDCEDVATCPSCSLIIRVIYDPVCVQSRSWFYKFSHSSGGSSITKIMRVRMVTTAKRKKIRIPTTKVSMRLSRTLPSKRRGRSPPSLEFLTVHTTSLLGSNIVRDVHVSALKWVNCTIVDTNSPPNSSRRCRLRVSDIRGRTRRSPRVDDQTISIGNGWSSLG